VLAMQRRLRELFVLNLAIRNGNNTPDGLFLKTRSGT
jgi:hypothetical protein